MEYHKPDDRWDIFGIKSFEDYCENAIVKAKFHPDVPADINEAFAMAEYMMAHSYYHYPLYHEAFSKVLRIIEMAVKLRCTQLAIPLEQMNAKRKRIEKRVLKALMDDLIKAEPTKKLQSQFEVARSLRNSTMHPDRHIYSGAMTKNYIKQSITLLNTLFLPESVFIQFQNELSRAQRQLSLLHKAPFILEKADKRYLIEKASLEAAIQIGDQWFYLLAGHPVILNANENLSNHNYIKPLCLQIKNMSCIDDKLRAVHEEDNWEILLYSTRHRTNIETYEAYQRELGAVDENDREMYRHYMSHEIGEVENDFWYQKLWSVD
jgi:hypothetical protein